MQTILLDGGRYENAQALHAALKRLLNLPQYYGMNTDALYDCLTERREPVNVWVAGMGEGETAKALTLCLQAFEDAGSTVREL